MSLSWKPRLGWRLLAFTLLTSSLLASTHSSSSSSVFDSSVSSHDLLPHYPPHPTPSLPSPRSFHLLPQVDPRPGESPGVKLGFAAAQYPTARFLRKSLRNGARALGFYQLAKLSIGDQHTHAFHQFQFYTSIALLSFQHARLHHPQDPNRLRKEFHETLLIPAVDHMVRFLLEIEQHFPPENAIIRGAVTKARQVYVLGHRMKEAMDKAVQQVMHVAKQIVLGAVALAKQVVFGIGCAVVGTGIVLVKGIAALAELIWNGLTLTGKAIQDGAVMLMEGVWWLVKKTGHGIIKVARLTRTAIQKAIRAAWTGVAYVVRKLGQLAVNVVEQAKHVAQEVGHVVTDLAEFVVPVYHVRRASSPSQDEHVYDVIDLAQDTHDDLTHTLLTDAVHFAHPYYVAMGDDHQAHTQYQPYESEEDPLRVASWDHQVLSEDERIMLLAHDIQQLRQQGYHQQANALLHKYGPQLI